MDRSDPLERTHLSTRALEFLLDLQDFDASQEESIGTLCVLAEELQPGAVVGGTIIDGRSATLDRVVFPSLPPSSFRTICHSRISPPYIGTCAQAVCEERIVVCSDVATDTRFDAGWRRLYIDLGLQSVQSAPVFSLKGRALGTFVVAFRQPRASFDLEMAGFGVYGMRTILQKPSCYKSGPRTL
jgi:GAF domain-containing protein